jgi:hypothetical protein
MSPRLPTFFYKSLTTAACEDIDPDLVEDDLWRASPITLVDIMFWFFEVCL